LDLGRSAARCPRFWQGFKYNLRYISRAGSIMAETVGKVRRVGGSLMVTIPKEVAAAEGISEGTTLQMRIVKKRRSAFGAFPGLAPWRHEGDWGHD